MNRGKLGAMLALLMLAWPTAMSAENVVLPSMGELVVEGHTVFTVLDEGAAAAAPAEPPLGTAPRLYAREAPGGSNGTLWFDDQFLVAPDHEKDTPARDEHAAVAVLVRGARQPFLGHRYPCGGAVLVVNSGDPDPRQLLVSANGRDAYQSLLGEGDPMRQGDDDRAIPAEGAIAHGPSGADQPGPASWLDASDRAAATTLATALHYVESSLITDPNDRAWIIDRYNAVTVIEADSDVPQVSQSTHRFPLWVVNVGGSPSFVPDDGVRSCEPVQNLPGPDEFLVRYNALVYLPLQEPGVDAGVRVVDRAPHTVGDVAGCQPGTHWACPGHDDHREGMSHGPRPGTDNPLAELVGHACSVPDREGPDGPCHPAEHAAHNVGAVDVYFSPTARPVEPPARNLADVDLAGSTDPYHAHES